MRKKNGRLDDERKKGHNEMDIYSSRCFGGCLFVVGMRMNSGENGTEGEKIEEREVGEGQVEGEGFGGQTDKQTTHRFPAALCHSRETPSPRTIRLHSSPLMLKTLHRRGEPPPPPRLVDPVLWTSLRDGASEVTLPGIISSDPGLHTGIRKLLKRLKW